MWTHWRKSNRLEAPKYSCLRLNLLIQRTGGTSCTRPRIYQVSARWVEGAVPVTEPWSHQYHPYQCLHALTRWTILISAGYESFAHTGLSISLTRWYLWHPTRDLLNHKRVGIQKQQNLMNASSYLRLIYMQLGYFHPSVERHVIISANFLNQMQHV